jgi:DNA oxidative demethylase
MSLDLFADDQRHWHEELCNGAVVLRHFAADQSRELLAALDDVVSDAPFRQMITPGGYRMSVAMTNCGTWGWTSDRDGYDYIPHDPLTKEPWPALPEIFQTLALHAAHAAGFPAFIPDACLINRYGAGARLSLHQDRDEQDFSQPIVSVSLGLPAVFLFGGARRSDKARRFPLTHGDVVVWGGPARRYYHGILPLKAGVHPLTGECRINLTFRKAR